MVGLFTSATAMVAVGFASCGGESSVLCVMETPANDEMIIEREAAIIWSLCRSLLMPQLVTSRIVVISAIVFGGLLLKYEQCCVVESRIDSLT